MDLVPNADHRETAQLVSVLRTISEILTPVADLNVLVTQTALETGAVPTTNALILARVFVESMPNAEWLITILCVVAFRVILATLLHRVGLYRLRVGQSNQWSPKILAFQRLVDPTVSVEMLVECLLVHVSPVTLECHPAAVQSAPYIYFLILIQAVFVCSYNAYFTHSQTQSVSNHLPASIRSARILAQVLVEKTPNVASSTIILYAIVREGAQETHSSSVDLYLVLNLK